jgi:hypothetical protein
MRHGRSPSGHLDNQLLQLAMIGEYRQAENDNQHKIATEHEHEQQWRLTISDPGNARGIRLLGGSSS